MSETREYKLPAGLSPFQEEFYKHLIEWKWTNITEEPGLHQGRAYDVMLPEELNNKVYPLYPPIKYDVIREHPFKIHKMMGKHMASSQAACINLFTPILNNPGIAQKILSSVIPSFKRLATDQLESGFQFEYWDKSNPFNDHTPAAGTDSDIAIAYYNDNDDLCLWLIEHKLTEREFTTCGGYRSSGNKHKDWCTSLPMLNDPDKCYYQYEKDYTYWTLTKESGLFKEDLLSQEGCPFRGGENQLWRNQLMAYAIQKQGIFKHVHFSVVYHHDNPHLQDTIERYSQLLKSPDVSHSFTSKDLIQAARAIDDQEIRDWATWFSDLYMID